MTRNGYTWRMNNHRKWILFLGDVATLAAAFMVVVFVKSGFGWDAGLGTILMYPFGLAGFVCVVMLYVFDLYDFRFIRPASSHLWRIGGALIGASIIAVIIFYFFELFPVDPKTTLAIFFVLFGGLFVAWRRAFYKIFSQSFKNKTVVWGISKTAEHLFEEIANNPHRGYEPLLHVHALPDLIRIINEKHFQILVIDDHLSLPDKLIEIIFEKQITVLSLLETYEEILQKVPLETIDETLFIQNMQQHGPIARRLMRIMECAIALLILTAFSPVLVIMMIAIKIEDGGPVLYKGNTRLGFLGKEFMLYKFRSMTVEEKRTGGMGHDWTIKNDPRVTRVGKIIRKLHIDELAQMINVLRGDIALVGPRPDVTAPGLDLKQKFPYYYLRHIVKPGFTGWAQIKYHAPASTEEFIERFQYDLYYIKHREFFFDFGIMARTVQIIFSHTL